MIVVAAISLALADAASVEPKPIEWGFPLVHDMTYNPEEGEPQKPVMEMSASPADLSMAQILLSTFENRFVMSVSNCPNGAKRIDTSVTVSSDLPVLEQVERFRAATPAASSIQVACGLDPVDPFNGNFLPLFSELIERSKAYQAARTEWLRQRSGRNFKKSNR